MKKALLHTLTPLRWLLHTFWAVLTVLDSLLTLPEHDHHPPFIHTPEMKPCSYRKRILSYTNFDSSKSRMADSHKSHS
jgi:hypothetical protein